MQTYCTFKRSCTNWKEFGRARKVIHDTGLTYEEALRQCERYNAERTPAQIRRGTKLEFTAGSRP
jgi:hypothetical protein